MWRSATHGLANISGNMIHVSYRPGPAPISVSGNITNDFIRSRTKPAFSIRRSQCFKGVQRNCEEDWDSRGRSVSAGRVILFGSLSLFVLGDCHFPLRGHRDPGRPITYKSDLPFLPAARGATFAHTPALIEPEDSVGAAAQGDVPRD